MCARLWWFRIFVCAINFVDHVVKNCVKRVQIVMIP